MSKDKKKSKPAAKPKKKAAQPPPKPKTPKSSAKTRKFQPVSPPPKKKIGASPPKKKPTPPPTQKPKPEVRTPTPPRPSDPKYEAHKERAASRSREISSKSREIGIPPDIEDVDRRERCRFNLRLFMETYNPQPFYFGWAKSQLREIDREEEAILYGALYALARPRGDGKTTRCRMAVTWAIVYGHRLYPFVIGAKQDKAEQNLSAIKTYLRFLPLISADFPEISYPIQRIAGIGQRAAGQTCLGKPTLIDWSQDRIVLPTMAPPANWPKNWKLRDDGMVPTSGIICGTSGLTGDGLRGSVISMPDGSSRRPDLFFLDDPQTRESAHSPTQNDTREQLVGADILGMAAPGQKVSAIMTCTVIANGDMADNILDRSKHPLWRGERSKMMESMPKNMKDWSAYFDVYRECSLKEPPDLAEANALYLARRAVLDEGAVAGWEDRKNPDEVSAIQHAMHLYFRNPRAFMAEYQNEPQALGPVQELRQLTEADLIAKLNTIDRRKVPRDVVKLTAFIDLQQEVLFWGTLGFTDKFGIVPIDYGAFPTQRQAVFTADSPSPTLSEVFPGQDLKTRLYSALSQLVPIIFGTGYQQQDSTGLMTVSLCLIDTGFNADVVHDYISRSPFKALLHGSKGRGIPETSKPMNDYSKDVGDQVGWNWRIDAKTTAKGRVVSYDTYAWKSLLAEAILAPPGSPGSFYLPGNKINEHPLFTLHLLSEYRKAVTADATGRRVEKWFMRPNKKENHYWDICVGACVAASILKLKWDTPMAAGEPALPQTSGTKPLKLSEIQKQKQAAANAAAGRR